ncbi:hypothetical protein D3C78_1284610 [compost metagenome]
MNTGNADNGGLQRINVAAGDVLERRHQLAGQHDRIHALMRACRMGSLAFYANHEAIDVGIKGASSGGKGSHRQTGFIMHTKNGAYAMQNASLYQHPGSGEVFFRRLKQQPHPASQLCFTCFQQQCRSQDHTAVNIMSASMHDAFMS